MMTPRERILRLEAARTRAGLGKAELASIAGLTPWNYSYLLKRSLLGMKPPVWISDLERALNIKANKSD